MGLDKGLTGKVIDQSSGVLEKAYDDLVHPSACSIGNTLSLLPRTIGVWLGSLEKWVINGEESIKLTSEAVQAKAKKIPEEKLTEPESYVAVPAIQQLSYCYNSEHLREMYANLLVSSMNIDTKYQVHPAFVDIIKQLTPDEAKLLKKLDTEKGYYPLIDLELYMGPSRGSVPIITNFTTLGDDVCDSPCNIGSYIENLDRLKIISILNEIHVMDSSRYSPLKCSDKIKEGMETPIPSGMTFIIKEKSFIVTEFGKAFIKVCVEEK